MSNVFGSETIDISTERSADTRTAFNASAQRHVVNDIRR